MNETTRYFREKVLSDRPYLTLDMCKAVLEDPLRSEREANGRLRFWAFVEIPGLGRRALRVVPLDDGKTIHNAFPDRLFR